MILAEPHVQMLLMSQEERGKWRAEKVNKWRQEKSEMGGDTVNANLFEAWEQEECKARERTSKHVENIQSIKGVKAMMSAREIERLKQQESVQQSKLKRQHEESILKKEATTVEEKWDDVLKNKSSVPQELHCVIEHQRTMCSNIIQNKGATLAALQEHLKGINDTYMEAINQQGEDIKALLSRVKDETEEFDVICGDEIKKVESEYLKERTMCLEANRDTMEELFEFRQQMELSLMEATTKRSKEHNTEVELLHQKGSNEYRDLKLQLEANIQTLENKLENTKATYKFKAEKLQYDSRMLNRTYEENTSKNTLQKTKMKKLLDSLSTLKEQYHETDSRHEKQNSSIVDGYGRSIMQYNNLLASCKQMSKAEDEKYEKVWNLHVDELGQLTKQAIQADEIICRGLLGWDWKGPNVQNLEQLLFIQNSAMDLEPAALRGGQQMKLNKRVKEADDVKISQEDDGGREEVDGIENKQHGCNDTIMDKAHISAMVTFLSQEASFLSNCSIEDDGDENNLIIKPDVIEDHLHDIPPTSCNILRALGIVTENGLKVLLSYFFIGSAAASPHSEQDKRDMFPSVDFERLGLDPNDPNAARVLSTIIEPNDVIGAIRRFVEDCKVMNPIEVGRTEDTDDLNITMAGVFAAAAAVNDDGEKKRVGSSGISKVAIMNEQKSTLQERKKELWEKAASIFDTQANTWKQLEQYLQMYSNLFHELEAESLHLKLLQTTTHLTPEALNQAENKELKLKLQHQHHISGGERNKTVDYY